MKTALICGVSGQDGAYLSKLLLEKAYRVIGSSRNANGLSFDNLKTLGIRGEVHQVSMAVNDFRSVLSVIKAYQPDEIYNLAGQSSVGLSFEQPVETLESINLGTLNILEAIRFLELDCKLYNAGSSECFGETSSTSPAHEGSKFEPRSPYAVAKASAHWLISNYREAYNIYACTGHLFNHESPLRHNKFVTKKIISTIVKISRNQAHQLKLGNLNVFRDWGWAPEYVEAMWMVLQQNHPQDFVIATGKTVSLEEFVRLSFQYLNLDAEKYLVVNKELFRPTDLQYSYADPSKAEKELGWRASYSVTDVVQKMIEYELEKYN